MKINKVTFEKAISLSIEERLKLSGAIDLRDNHTIEKDGHYMIIKPIDKTKVFK
jgi:hypothetical protein